MRKRAEAVDQTRLKITAAAVRLHTSVGPGRTTMSAVADEAGVSRVTLYRHFPDEAQMFTACSTHWARQHPGPDPSTWQQYPPIEPRARIALAELYAWFRENADALLLFERDAHAIPDPVRSAQGAIQTQMAEALVAGAGRRGRARRRLRAAAGHLVSFATWRSLALDQGLGDEAIDVAVGFLTAAARPPR